MPAIRPMCDHRCALFVCPLALCLQVRDCLQVEWLDPVDPEAGVAGLYLSEDDYTRLTAKAAPGQEVVRATVSVESSLR